jgi:flagellar basal-body rod protein FlgF
MQSPSLVMLSNQEVLKQALDVVANNVANSSTTGFKRSSIAFDTILSKASDPSQSTDFVGARATYRDTSNGPIQPTGNSLDLAIQGQGYFQVQMPDGTTRYTRGGAFQINSKNQLVTLSGQPLLTSGGAPIDIPDTITELNISPDGFISARTDNGANLSQLGKIAVVKFSDEQELQAQGGGLYATTQVSVPAPDSAIVQGALEQSNVQPILEMTDMIRIQRSYEQASNMISQDDSRQTSAINILSKTTA